MVFNEKWEGVVSDVDEVLDFPQDFGVSFVEVEFELILFEEIASASSEDGDDRFDIVLIEFVYFFEEFFFVSLCHILFKIAHAGENFVFFLFGEGVLVEFFKQGCDLFLHLNVSYFAAGEFVAAF